MLTTDRNGTLEDRRCRYQDMGGRHYSDRCYSDSPQSGRPSTSLARLGICRNNIGENGGVEASHALKGRHCSNTIVLPMIFGIWFGVFPTGTARAYHDGHKP